MQNDKAKFKIVFIAVISAGFFGLADISLAAPAVSSVSGNITHGQNITISGSGFGIKNSVKPLLYADFSSSINPNATLGQRSSWDVMGCISWTSGSECPSGGGCIRSTAGTQDCFESHGVVLGLDYTAWNIPGTSFYVYQKHRMNFLVDGSLGNNWKNYRMWPTVQSYPNCYESVNNDRIGCEIGSDSSMESCGMTAYLPTLAVQTTNWYVEEFLVKVGDIAPTKNGKWILYRDGLQIYDVTLCMKGSGSANVDITRFYPVHDVAAGITDGRWPNWSSNNRTWADDVYVDTTWSRVMICTGSTWSSRGACEIQIPSAWSDTSATIAVNAGTLTGDNYLYVVDSTNTANANGYPVTIGATSDTTPPAAPTGVAVI